MCTVSFVATNDKIIITSNRDEHTLRPSAIPPQFYEINHHKLIFPRDPKAGGTWFVIFQSNLLFQMRWNGTEKETTPLDIKQNYIWSSSTLYASSIRDHRSIWFYDFLERNTKISETKMFNFHRNTEGENTENGLVINRDDILKTLSITQAVLEKNTIALLHHDLISNQDFLTSFSTT